MDRPGHNDIKFFFGREVEHTPAFGMNTLFVVGLHSVESIQQQLDDKNTLTDQSHHVNHIYFGANQSFPKLRYEDADKWRQWENMILPFLGRGHWCTLDLDISCVPGLTDGSLCEQDLFIPMISVKIPYIRTLGYNAVIKIDDTDFAHSTPGVWCHSLHNLQNRDHFTDWSKYRNDVISEQNA